MKKPVGIKLDEVLIQRAKKLAEKNKKEFKLPNNFNSIIGQALADYLKENKG